MQISPPAFYDEWALPKIWASMSGKVGAIRRRRFYDEWAFPFNGRSHLKQFGKTLIQAIRIEFSNLSNAIRQKVRLGCLAGLAAFGADQFRLKIGM